jgi:DNA-binding beta-propeller fold protein YncE
LATIHSKEGYVVWLHTANGSGRKRHLLWLAAASVVLFATAGPARAASVYVTDSGENKVSQFSVGPGGKLSPKSPAKLATGKSPRGVAVSPDGTSAYVVNPFSANISQYAVLAGGGLSPLTPRKVPAAADQLDYPQYVALSPDGGSAYVTTFGDAGGVNGAGGTVLQYDVGPDGHLTRISPFGVAAGDGTFGVAVSPNGKSLYATDAVGSFDENLSQFNIGAGGKLSPKTPAAVGAANTPLAVAVRPDGQSVYVVNNFSNTVSQYTAGAGGKLRPKTPATVATGHYPAGVAVSPDGQSVYVANSYSGEGRNGTISQYNVGPGGKLSPKSPATVAAGRGPRGLALTPNGKSMYVANTDGNDLWQYNVGPGGKLSPKSPARVATGKWPVGVAVSP